LKKEKKKFIRKKKLCRPTVPNFFGDVSGNKEHFFTPGLTIYIKMASKSLGLDIHMRIILMRSEIIFQKK